MFGDPLLRGGVGLEEVLIVLLKGGAAFVLMILAVVLMIWFERKVIGDLQNRIGPTMAGPFGLLQTLADGIKLIFKQDIIPSRADRFVFALAPFLSMVPAFVSFGIVPLGGNFQDNGGVVTWFGHETYVQLADPPIGILVLLSMSSIAVYGIILAGWSSGSKYPLLGSVRATAQAISYEAALGLSLASVLLVSGSLSTHDIVALQAGEGFFGIVPNWNVLLTGIVPFAIFIIAAAAELNRAPFDLVEAEQELVGGFHTEYSSIRFGHFYLAEYMNLITMSAIMVTLFFGGPSGPVFGPGILQALLPSIWFFLKVLVFLFVAVWTRATLPRFRYDQLMDLGWKVLIPLALGWLLLLATIRIGNDRDWNAVVVVGVCIAVFALAASLLNAALVTARRARPAAEEVL